MNNKVIYSGFISTIFCAGILFYYTKINLQKLAHPNSCVFCDKQILDRQKFYEDDLVIALCTHKPIIQSHFLIIPKRHVKRLEMLSLEEVSHIYQVIGKVNRASVKAFQTSSYLIHQKNGLEVGQSVPHVHFHLIAKRTGDSSSVKFLTKLLIAHLKRPISSEEIYKTVEKMKAAIKAQELSFSQDPLIPKLDY